MQVYIGDSVVTDAEALPLRLPIEPGGLVSWRDTGVTVTYDKDLGGGNTGLLRPGESSAATYDYSVQVSDGEWIAIRSDLDIEDVSDSDASAPAAHARSEVVIRYCKLGGTDIWSCAKYDSGDGGHPRDAGGHG